MKLDLSTGCLITVEQEELDRRIRGVRRFMEERKLGLCLTACPMKGGWKTWLTGTEGPGRPSEGAILVGRTGDVISVNGGSLVPRGAKGERNYAMAPGLEGDGFLGYGSTEGFSADLIEEMLGDSRKIGLVNGEFLRANVFEYLKETIPDIEILDISREMEAFRAVKSQAEIRILESNARMMDKVFAGAGVFINPLKYERDIVNDLRYSAYRLGCGGVDHLLSAPCELVSCRDGAPREEEPLNYPGRKVTFGDRVSIRMYAIGNDGYFAGMSRLYVLGEPAESTKKLWETAVEAQDYAAELLKPGAVLKEIAETVNGFLKERGMQEDRRTMIHSIGASVQENPQVFGTEPMAVQENMVFYVGPTVNDGVTEPVSCGDLYLVTKEGAVRLNHFSRELIRLY
ncbi:MAG: M24 family metallopeptidase [Candidatus Limivivens sp.]|nr:M24 family metallopeptidase [Candidatus Limivivens sp.]